MLVTIDKSELSSAQKELPIRALLAELVEAVGKANPLLNFACDKNCVTKEWNRELQIGRAHV